MRVCSKIPMVSVYECSSSIYVCFKLSPSSTKAMFALAEVEIVVVSSNLKVPIYAPYKFSFETSAGPTSPLQLRISTISVCSCSAISSIG